jgi:hypothetical protein
MLIANSKSIVELVTKRRLPSIAFKEIAEDGGLGRRQKALHRFVLFGRRSFHTAKGRCGSLS